MTKKEADNLKVGDNDDAGRPLSVFKNVYAKWNITLVERMFVIMDCPEQKWYDFKYLKIDF